jgi:hypothetical protein
MTTDFVRYEKATFQTSSSEICNMYSSWIQFLPTLHSLLAFQGKKMLT